MEFLVLFLLCVFAKKILEAERSSRNVYFTAEPKPVKFDPELVVYEKDLRRRAGL